MNQKKPQRPRSQEAKRLLIAEIIFLLKKYYPITKCALNHKSVFELLVATILSAQCTDERVNAVTPRLFEKLAGPKSFAVAKVEEIEDLFENKV